MKQFEAMYDGACSECDGRIHAGDLVSYVDNAIAHVDCNEAPAAVGRAGVCPVCWLVFPCGCDPHVV